MVSQGAMSQRRLVADAPRLIRQNPFSARYRDSAGQ